MLRLSTCHYFVLTCYFIPYLGSAHMGKCPRLAEETFSHMNTFPWQSEKMIFVCTSHVVKVFTAKRENAFNVTGARKRLSRHKLHRVYHFLQPANGPPLLSWIGGQLLLIRSPPPPMGPISHIFSLY